MTSEREEVLNEFGTAECVKRDDCTHFDCVAERNMAEAIVRLRRALTTAERERDEARREREDYKAMYLDLLDAAKRHETEREALRHRAERAEAEAAYIRRAFRGAVESDALAVTYKTVGSYRAGLLKTINALDTTEPTP